MATELLEKPATESSGNEAQMTCVHHWVIDPPEGQFSKGRCLKCGEEQKFQNYFPYSKWNTEPKDRENIKSILAELGL